MLQKLLESKNYVVDWFIKDKHDLSKAELFFKRRFVEAVFGIGLSLLAVSILKFYGFRGSYPSEIGLLVVFFSLFLFRKFDSTLVAGNLVLIFIFGCLLYETLSYNQEITAYIRWFVLFPMFSLLFMDKYSTLAWSSIIILSTFSLYGMNFENHTILSQPEFKKYFFTDSILFFSVFLLMVYIYHKGKEILSNRLIQDKLEINEKSEKLFATSQQLIETNKDLEAYAYVVSHDLKNPIRGINSFSEILEKHLLKENKLDDESKKYLHYIIGNSKQMSILVDDILYYSSLDSKQHSEYVDTNLNDTLLAILNSFEPSIKEYNISFELDTLPTLKVLPSLTYQLFQNLIANAIKFRDKERACLIKIKVINQEDAYNFSIVDNGIGISTEHLDSIFAPFKRLHGAAQYEGSGIGLATCVKIVEKHQGKIWANSELGKGTSFHFTLSKNL